MDSSFYLNAVVGFEKERAEERKMKGTKRRLFVWVGKMRASRSPSAVNNE